MKTKALISFVVTARLIRVFVFTYAKSRFSHDKAQMIGVNSNKLSGLSRPSKLNESTLYFQF